MNEPWKDGDGEEWKPEGRCGPGGCGRPSTPEGRARSRHLRRMMIDFEAAMDHLGTSAARTAKSVEALGRFVAEIETVERMVAEGQTTAILAQVYGVPVEWLDEFLRLRAEERVDGDER
jgi:hypothetical protein